MKGDLSQYHDKVTPMKGGYLICFKPPRKYSLPDDYWFGFIHNDKIYALGWDDSLSSIDRILQFIHNSNIDTDPEEYLQTCSFKHSSCIKRFFKNKYPEMLLLLPNWSYDE